MNKSNEQTYICTRSRLARLLIDQGQSYKPIPNPWEPQRQAWLFTMTDTVVFVVASFYRSEGKPIPQYIRNAAKIYGVEV